MIEIFSLRNEIKKKNTDKEKEIFTTIVYSTIID